MGNRYKNSFTEFEKKLPAKILLKLIFLSYKSKNERMLSFLIDQGNKLILLLVPFIA